MSWLARIVGTVLILLAIEDLFFTALFPGNYRGVVQIPLRRVLWRGYRLLTGSLPRFHGRLLTYTGPLLIVAHVATWLALLTVGFALVAWPELGTAIRDTQGRTDTNFWTALYFSGYSLTTLGTGDVVATTALYRLVMVLEAFVGFSTITLALTYFLAIYSALVRRGALAATLDARTEGTGDAARMLLHVGAGGDFTGGGQDIGQIAASLIEVMESHRYYPILRYFHFHDARNSIPRLLFLTLDTATLIRSGLDCDRYRAFVDSSAVTELWYGVNDVLRDLSRTLVPQHATKAPRNQEEAWRARYIEARRLLKGAGIATAPDCDAGARSYSVLRGEWEPHLAAIAEYLAYDWTAIAPRETLDTAETA